jgi:hypothetical protein
MMNIAKWGWRGVFLIGFFLIWCLRGASWDSRTLGVVVVAWYMAYSVIVPYFLNEPITWTGYPSQQVVAKGHPWRIVDLVLGICILAAALHRAFAK